MGRSLGVALGPPVIPRVGRSLGAGLLAPVMAKVGRSLVTILGAPVAAMLGGMLGALLGTAVRREIGWPICLPVCSILRLASEIEEKAPILEATNFAISIGADID